jgi:putative ABC transport system permease protein
MTAILTKTLGRLPLGWLQLVHNRTQLLSAVAGVAFANILIFMQLGFLGAIKKTSTLMHESWDADIIIASSDFKSLREASSIPRARMLAALKVEGVTDVTPFFVNTIPWTNPHTGNSMNLRVMGVPTEGKTYIDPELQRYVNLLKEPRTAILDSRSRGLDQEVFDVIREKGSYEIEISGIKIRFIGAFAQGASFDVDGSLITSDQTFLEYFRNNRPGTPILGFVHCAPGSDLEAIAAGINAVFPENDVRAFTKEAFIQAEQDYQQKITPIGFVFGFGVVVGLIVGLVMVYQILTTDVQNHLSEYATFKAMGYPQRYFLGIIFEQAVCLAAMGFIPGLLISKALYHFTQSTIALPLEMPVGRIVFVFALTVIMCVLSGAIATRRLANAQPAELF